MLQLPPTTKSTLSYMAWSQTGFFVPLGPKLPYILNGCWKSVWNYLRNYPQNCNRNKKLKLYFTTAKYLQTEKMKSAPHTIYWSVKDENEFSGQGLVFSEASHIRGTRTCMFLKGSDREEFNCSWAPGKKLLRKRPIPQSAALRVWGIAARSPRCPAQTELGQPRTPAWTGTGLRRPIYNLLLHCTLVHFPQWCMERTHGVYSAAHCTRDSRIVSSYPRCFSAISSALWKTQILQVSIHLEMKRQSQKVALSQHPNGI